MSWEELGEGVYRRHYESLRLNIGVVLADQARDGWESHVPAQELSAGGPFPANTTRTAVERAYAELEGYLKSSWIRLGVGPRWP
ncbi:MAG: hypothetical protein ACE5MI_00560 [Acidimicrobiia bacterium]